MVAQLCSKVGTGPAPKLTANGAGKPKRGKSFELKLVARNASRAVQLDQVKRLCAKKWSASRVHSTLVTEFGATAIPYRTVAWHCSRMARIAGGWKPNTRGKKTDETTASSVIELHIREPAISANEISRCLKVPQSSVRRYLKLAGAKYMRAQIVPHLLTAAQKQARVELCRGLLAHLRDKKRWPLTVTGDESLIELESSVPGIWVLPNEHQPVRQAKQMTTKKTLLSVFFSTSGFHSVHFFESGQTVNAEYCISCYADVSRSLGWRPFFIHLDNARAHYANPAKLWLQDHDVTVLQHPPYSPDLAPCDFWLFGFLKVGFRAGTLKLQSLCERQFLTYSTF